MRPFFSIHTTGATSAQIETGFAGTISASVGGTQVSSVSVNEIPPAVSTTNPSFTATNAWSSPQTGVVLAVPGQDIVTTMQLLSEGYAYSGFTTAAAPYAAIQVPVEGQRPGTWFTECTADKIAYSSPTSPIIGYYPVTTPNAKPHYLTIGSDANVWFTEYGAGQIGRITPNGATLTEFPLADPGAEPQGIDTGATGQWFAEYADGKIGKISNTGVIAEYSIPSGTSSQPYAVYAGGTDSVWFTEQGASAIGHYAGGTISEYSTPTPSSQPTSLTLGPDGALWFTEAAAHKIGRITSNGTIIEFSVPFAPFGIANPGYGALYFTNASKNEIGILQ